MAELRNEGTEGPDGDPGPAGRSERRWRRIAAFIGLVLLLVLLVAVAALWIARRPIATNILENEFERRGVEATYELERVGLRTQVVRNLVIGDPADPDLRARYAVVQLRIKLNGKVEVYRILARGVRLEGRVEGGRVVWGDVSKLLPPPSGKPFEFPNIALDLADSSISLQTPFGPMGFALEGRGNLTGGFKGRLAAASPGLDPGRCQTGELNALVAIEIVARRPWVVGPLSLSRFACPASRFLLESPTFEIDSRFSESFTTFDGRGRMSAGRLIAGDNGLAELLGNISFKGSPQAATGRFDAAARRSRLGPVYADRTRVSGHYRLSATRGRFAMQGAYEAQDANLQPAILAGITDPLAAAANTPIGPVAVSMARAFQATARAFDAQGKIDLVNAPGGGLARVETASVRARTGARVEMSGGSGVTYYWPSAKIRVDGRLRMAGGGLPTGTVVVRQDGPGAGISGVADLQPYRVGSSRLALTPVRFAAQPNGATRFSTTAELDGPFPDGRVRALRVPVTGRFGADGSLLVGPGCITASWQYFRMRDIQFGPARLPICPIGQAIIVKRTDAPLRVSARIDGPNLRGRIGSAPLALRAARASILENRDFSLADVEAAIGKADSPVRIEAGTLKGTFRGAGITGTFADSRAVIGNVPLLLSESSGNWEMQSGDLRLSGRTTVSDRADEPRFYPLSSDDFLMTLKGNDILAGGTLRHPQSGTKVTDVTVRHDLSSGVGDARLDVPGIAFGDQIQPEDLTPLTQGVVALVRGVLSGQGRIAWDGEGEVESSGEFTTARTDLAAPFGPVEGLSTTVRFSDLLGLETQPGQTARVDLINPGIPVRDGVITYQLLSDQRVRIQRGEWPFMGGRLILRETILNFARPTPKRLTFEVVGFDAKAFIDSLGFEGIEIVGTFDGVLPMIFDDEGGRIVGGRLDARAPGGTFRYTGTRPDAGLMAGVAFDLLSNLDYRQMTIRLDGDLAGEFATRFTIRDVSLGQGGGLVTKLVRNAFKKVPLIVNLNIKGPFRALIQTAKAFEDPTVIIQPVMPFPLDLPGIVTETRTLRKDEEQDRTTELDEIDVSTQQPSE